MNFSLPTYHHDKKIQSRRQNVKEKHNNQKEKPHMNEADVRIGVLIGTITSEISATGPDQAQDYKGTPLSSPMIIQVKFSIYPMEQQQNPPR